MGGVASRTSVQAYKLVLAKTHNNICLCVCIKRERGREIKSILYSNKCARTIPKINIYCDYAHTYTAKNTIAVAVAIPFARHNILNVSDALSLYSFRQNIEYCCKKRVLFSTPSFHLSVRPSSIHFLLLPNIIGVVREGVSEMVLQFNFFGINRSFRNMKKNTRTENPCKNCRKKEREIES